MIGTCLACHSGASDRPAAREQGLSLLRAQRSRETAVRGGSRSPLFAPTPARARCASPHGEGRAQALEFSFSCCLIPGRAGEGCRGGPAPSAAAAPCGSTSPPGWGQGLVPVFLHPGTSRAACGWAASPGQDFQECSLLTTQARPHMPDCGEL